MLDAVGDGEQGRSSAGEAGEQVEHELGRRGIEGRRGLVEQEDTWSIRERPRQRHPQPLAAREVLRGSRRERGVEPHAL
jgi:hypothetical protein